VIFLERMEKITARQCWKAYNCNNTTSLWDTNRNRGLVEGSGKPSKLLAKS
jgi:hypothetical protein